MKLKQSGKEVFIPFSIEIETENELMALWHSLNFVKGFEKYCKEFNVTHTELDRLRFDMFKKLDEQKRRLDD